jgi:predicted DCC family thiol-disulfide oxidoreductase YuxK
MEPWVFEIFVDGGCAVCSREVRWLRWLDRGRQRLRITDLTEAHATLDELGISFDTAMRSIHGRRPDGTVVTGVEVFRAAYAAVGLGWVLAPTRLPGLRQLSDAAYRVFARWRYRRRRHAGCPMPSQR